MLISTRKGFGFLFVPKCASTSIQSLIKKHCNIVFSAHPKLKHISYLEYETNIQPLLLAKELGDIHFFAVIRDPMDWVKSWYRYRSRDILQNQSHRNHDNYTGGISFAGFVEEVVSEKPKLFARIRSQSHFLLGSNGDVGVKTLLPMEHLTERLPKLLDQFGIGKSQALPVRNKSLSKVDIAVDRHSKQLIQSHFQRDYEIYETYS